MRTRPTLTRLAGALALLAVLGTAAQAQQKIEVGTGLGVSILTNGSTVTTFGMPGGGIISQATMHASFGDRLMIYPEIAFNLVSGGGSTATTIGMAANVGYLFSGAGMNSPYFAASGAFQFVDAFGSATAFAAGAKVGYRLIVGESLAVRLEAGYRRWFNDFEGNEIIAGIRLGALIGS
jgi:hypothetical protein